MRLINIINVISGGNYFVENYTVAYIFSLFIDNTACNMLLNIQIQRRAFSLIVFNITYS